MEIDFQTLTGMRGLFISTESDSVCFRIHAVISGVLVACSVYTAITNNYGYLSKVRVEFLVTYIV